MEKSLKNCGEETESRKMLTLVVGKKSNGKSRLKSLIKTASMKINRKLLVSLFTAVCLSAGVSKVHAQSGIWTTNYPSSPSQRRNVTAAALNGILYVAGGSPPNSTGSVNTLEAYNPASNTWTTLPSMPEATQQACAGVVNGILYVVGGCSCCTCYPYLQAYNPASNSWTLQAPMPTARTGHRVGVVDGILYVIGGADGFEHNIYSTVEAYNPASNTWTTMSPMPAALQAGSIGVVNGILYYIGGLDGTNVLQSTIYEYNPAANSWVAESAMATPLNGCGSGELNGFIYLVGGGNSVGPVNTVYAYNTLADAWTTQTSLPVGFGCSSSGNTADVINDALYAVCETLSDLKTGGTGFLNLAAFTPSAITLTGNLAFGNVTLGTSTNRTLTINNADNLNLTVSNISYPPGFSGTNWTGGTIVAGGSTNVTVTFSPTAESNYSGVVTVNSDAKDSILTIPISGFGVPLTPLEKVSITATVIEQGATKDNGTTTTTKAPTKVSWITTTLLKQLAADEFAEGKLLSATLPAGAKLDFNGTGFEIDQGSKELVDVSDILTWTVSGQKDISGAGTYLDAKGQGIPPFNQTDHYLVTVAYNGSNSTGALTFTVTGLATVMGKAANPNPNTGYTLSGTVSLADGTGAGVNANGQFILTGFTISASGSEAGK